MTDIQTQLDPDRQSKSPIPNLFIIGAPKTGTTALANYLSEHPAVFFSQPKELYYWDFDHSKTTIPHRPTSLEQYLSHFAEADPVQHRVIGEGTTTYAQSEVAVSEIIRLQPTAKFILMLRHPVDLVHSLHEHLLRRGGETVRDFERAWSLQETRAAGSMIPGHCETPHQLQYRKVATFAPQLQRLFELVPAAQRQVILFDDFIRDTRQAYLNVLRFLELPDDGRQSFPKLNAARQPRVALLKRFAKSPPKFLSTPIKRIYHWYQNSNSPVQRMLRRLVVRQGHKTQLSEDLRQRLLSEFAQDIQQTSQLIHRDLSHWMQPGVTASASVEQAAEVVP